MQTLRGIRDLIPFLNDLDRQNIYYRIEHQRDETVMVVVVLVGMRLEVDFFDDHVEYNFYEGDEAVFRDQARMFEFIRRHKEG